MMISAKRSNQSLNILYGIAAVFSIILGIRLVLFTFISIFGFLLMSIPAIHSFMMQQLTDAGMTDASLWEIIFFWLILLITLAARFGVALGLFRLTDDFRKQPTLDAINMTNFKLILIADGGYIVAAYIGSFVSQIFNLTGISLFGGETLTNILIWLVLYTVYLIFKTRSNSVSDRS